MSVTKLKLVVVGDGECGKTSLLYAFAKDMFFDEYTPTVFETYVTDITVDDKKVELSLWDTAGQEGFDRLRPLSYPNTDVMVICYSVANPDSISNILPIWLPEVRHFCGNVPIILVGNKKDLRDEAGAQVVPTKTLPMVDRSEGERIKEHINAAAFVECSARTREGIHEVFETAVRSALKPKNRTTNNRKCKVL